MSRSSTDYESTDKDYYEVNVSNARKCIRKGDTIYYSKPENINMMRNVEKIPLGSTTASSYETEKADKILSGESLYKSFTFEQNPKDEETEKCIAFWKSVMDKNLAPIKCALIESKSNKLNNTDEAVIKQEKDADAQVMALKKSEEEKKYLEQEIQKVHDQYRTMWKNIFNEIQKRKLKEIELIGNSRCNFCESITPNRRARDKKIDQSEIARELKELDDWKSPGWVHKIGEFSPKKAKSLEKSTKGQESNHSIHKEADLENLGEDHKTTDELTSWSELAEKKSPVNYTFENVIETKKQNNVYDEWRTNKLKFTCICSTPSSCRCNQNPAVQAIVSMKVPAQRKSALKQHLNFKPPDDNIVIPSACLPTGKNTQILIRASNSSLELAKQRISKVRMKHSSEELITVLQLKSKTDLDSSIIESSVKPSHIQKNIHKRRSSILKTKRKEMSPPIRMQCNCSVENCDCPTIMPIKEQESVSQPSVSARPSFKRDSLEVIRKQSATRRSVRQNLNDWTDEENPTSTYVENTIRKKRISIKEIPEDIGTQPTMRNPLKRNSLEPIAGKFSSTTLLYIEQEQEEIDEEGLTVKITTRESELDSEQNRDATIGNQASKDNGNITSTAAGAPKIRSQNTQNDIEIINLYENKVLKSDS